MEHVVVESVQPDIERLHLLIIEDNGDICAELKHLLAGDERLANLEFANSLSAARKLDATLVDVVLLDLQLGDGNGLDLVPYLRQANPDVRVLVFTIAVDERSTLRAVQLGVDGYILKDDPDIAQKLFESDYDSLFIDQRVTKHLVERLRGPQQAELVELTNREQQTLEGLHEGLSYVEIAVRLGISPKTVPSHIKSLYRKLGASSRGQAVYQGLQHNLLLP